MVTTPEDINIGSADLDKFLRSNSTGLETHLECTEKDFPIPQTQAKLHCHFVIVDQNGHDHLERLTELMAARIVDYAIPRKKIREAQEKDAESKTAQNILFLNQEAQRLFTDIGNSGEGGELLLFMLAENFLGLPQALCKMSLKTDKKDHFKGSDGVYLGIDDQANLLLYWGESKIYSDIQASIRECLKSLSPFLLEPENKDAQREDDIFLLNNNINFDDENVLKALRLYLDKNNPKNRKVKYCGIALAGFSHACYQADAKEKTIEIISKKIKEELQDWTRRIKGRIDEEKLQKFDIHFFCIAISNAESFRASFAKQLGQKISLSDGTQNDEN